MPTDVKPGWPVEGKGPPWFMAGETATPLGILSFNKRPTFWRRRGSAGGGHTQAPPFLAQARLEGARQQLVLALSIAVDHAGQAAVQGVCDRRQLLGARGEH